jgi:hypothetical protein
MNAPMTFESVTFGALLGEASDELMESLFWVLAAASEVLGIPRVHVCALKVPHKDPDHGSTAAEGVLARL